MQKRIQVVTSVLRNFLDWNHWTVFAGDGSFSVDGIRCRKKMNFAAGISVHKLSWSEISGPQSAIKSAISPPVRHHPHSSVSLKRVTDGCINDFSDGFSKPCLHLWFSAKPCQISWPHHALSGAESVTMSQIWPKFGWNKLGQTRVGEIKTEIIYATVCRTKK